MDTPSRHPTAGTRLSRRSMLVKIGQTAGALSVLGLLAACGGGSVGGGGTGHTIEMRDNLKFVPDTISVKVGDKITWKNAGAIVHTATDDPKLAKIAKDAFLPSGAQAWNSGDVQPGQSWSHTIDKAGDYTYFCIPHEDAGMIGRITAQ